MKKLTSIFLLGCIALLYFAFGPYPPLDSAGTFWGVFIPSFAVLAMILRDAREEQRATLKHVFAALLPWIFALLFLGNGALDHSEERQYPTVVIETRYSYRSGMRDTLVVESWRPGRKTESLRVGSYQRFFYSGDRVTVGVKSGALGLPWITSVSRDDPR
jgi:hypothetical protein